MEGNWGHLRQTKVNWINYGKCFNMLFKVAANVFDPFHHHQAEHRVEFPVIWTYQRIFQLITKNINSKVLMSARSSNREKHSEMGATANLSTRLVFLLSVSKRLEQAFAAEMTLGHLQSTVGTQLVKSALHFGFKSWNIFTGSRNLFS